MRGGASGSGSGSGSSISDKFKLSPVDPGTTALTVNGAQRVGTVMELVDHTLQESYGLRPNHEDAIIAKVHAIINKGWIPDGDYENCMGCNKPFSGWSRRRHHCRYCGQVLCKECMAQDEISLNHWVSSTQGNTVKTALSVTERKQKSVCKVCFVVAPKIIAYQDDKMLNSEVLIDRSMEVDMDVVTDPELKTYLMAYLKPIGKTDDQIQVELEQLIVSYIASKSGMTSVKLRETIEIMYRDVSQDAREALKIEADIPLEFDLTTYLRFRPDYVAEKMVKNMKNYEPS